MAGANTQISLIEGTDPLNLELEPWPIDKNWILSGEPAAAGTVLNKSDDGKTAAGVWECTPGSFRWEYTWDETVYILKGDVTITPEGGDPIRFKSGDVGHFANGLKTRWEVAETVRKVFFLHSERPLSL